MTASRYAASITLNTWEIQEHPKFLEALKDRMRRDLGAGLFKIIEEEIKKPVTVRLSWQESPRVEEWNDQIRLALVADIFPVEILQIRMVEFEPEWSYYPSLNSDRHLPIEWQCAYCGQTNLIAEHLDCRKCGAPRNPLR